MENSILYTLKVQDTEGVINRNMTNRRPGYCIYPVMNPIQWPKTVKPKRPITEKIEQISLPELNIADSDYEIAAEALRELDGRLSHVAYLNEVAKRVCRERQLRESLAKLPEHQPGEELIKGWKRPVAVERLGSEPLERRK